jgi:hypothetical protein
MRIASQASHVFKDCNFCNLLLEIVYVTIFLQNLFLFRNNTRLHTFVFLQNECIYLIHFEKITNEDFFGSRFNILVSARALVTCQENFHFVWDKQK